MIHKSCFTGKMAKNGPKEMPQKSVTTGIITKIETDQEIGIVIGTETETGIGIEIEIEIETIKEIILVPVETGMQIEIIKRGKFK